MDNISNIAGSLNVSKKVISNKTKISYAVYFAGQMCFYLLVANFINTYMTDIGIPIATVSVILVLARVWDAINDPLFGIIVDKTHWKSGEKYMPWIKLSAILITVSCIFMFTCPSSLSVGVKTAWVGIGYVCWGMSYTMCDIPIYALPTALTDDIKKRSVIISIGRIGNMLTAVIISVLFPILRVKFGWTVMGVVLSVVGIFLMLPLIFTGKETNKVKNSENITLKELLLSVIKNKYLLIFYAAMLINGMLAFSSVTSLYFARYCLGNESMASVISLIGTVPMIVVMFIIPIMIKRIDKFKIYYIASIGNALIGVLRYVAGYSNLTVFYVLSILQGICAGFTMTLMYMFTPDCIEYGNFVNKTRSSGIMFSVQTFCAKMQTAVSGALGMIVLGMFNFRIGENVHQSTIALKGIWMCTALFPTIGAIIAVIILSFYRLRDKDVQIMSECNIGKITHEEAVKMISKTL